MIGIGLGGDYSVGHTLLAEFSPRRHRGILLGAFSVVWTVGYVLASIAGHHFITESPEAWRWLLASAALPALLITLLRWGTPESPRWLLRQGRFAEAHAIVHRYFGPHVLLGDEVATATHKHIKTLFSSRYWRRTAFNSVFSACKSHFTPLPVAMVPRKPEGEADGSYFQGSFITHLLGHPISRVLGFLGEET